MRIKCAVVATALALLPRAAAAEDLDIDVGPEKILIANGAVDPRIAFDGEVYVLVWQDERNAATTGTDIYVARIATDGTILDPGGIAVTTAAGNQAGPRVASNGDDFFVIWAEGDRLAGARVGGNSAGLTVGPRIELPGRTNQRSHAVGRSGSDYVVVRAQPYDVCSYDNCTPSFRADLYRGSDTQNLSSKRFYAGGLDWSDMDTFDVVTTNTGFAVSLKIWDSGKIVILGADGAFVAALNNAYGPGVARASSSGSEMLALRHPFKAPDGITVARLSSSGVLLPRPEGATPLLAPEEYSVSRVPFTGAASAVFDGLTSLTVVTATAVGIGGEVGIAGARLRLDGSVVGDPKRNAQWIAQGGEAPLVAAGPTGEVLVAYYRANAVTARVVRTGDGIPDGADNCVGVGNADQLDANANGVGDACEDQDADGISDLSDNCPLFANGAQQDGDGDGRGDRCDVYLDRDDDGHVDSIDNCPTVYNPGQEGGGTVGYACDGDLDDDNIPDYIDLCPGMQAWSNDDFDGDGVGDACDSDDDGDGAENPVDNCLRLANPEQSDLDGDLEGDACDLDDDGDAYYDELDNCPVVPNNDQLDVNGDDIGDACQMLTIEDRKERGGCHISTSDPSSATSTVPLLALVGIVALIRRRAAKLG